MAYKTITQMTDGDYPVSIQVNDTGDQYRVTYGLHMADFTNWVEAAHEYSYCVFHSLECAGLINRGE